MEVYTRSMNPLLYEKMKSLLPENIKLVQCETFMNWQDAREYLHYIINNTTEDWIINLDEDCFITDWSKVESLIEYMKENLYDYCGMPDGGVSSHRSNSWVVINPFFNIFNASLIKKAYDKFTKEEIDSIRYNEDMEKYKPEFITGPINHDNNELYCGFFYFLFKYYRPLFLNADNHIDGISTILKDNNNSPFCLHSWYSREYLTVPEQRQRIDNLYEEAFSNSTI